MRHKKLKLIIVILLCLGLTDLHAQSAIPASGGMASGTNGLVCYSVGQMVYHFSTNTDGYSMAEGVQSPWEISLIPGIDDAKEVTIECVIYPNPTDDLLKLIVEEYTNENLSYQLYDTKGTVLESRKITGYETTIRMANHVSTIYFLTVYNNNKVIKSFKLIKN